ncbi:MAG: spermidine/putrescine ABC transporter substrate-binding protein [Gammaproteobacteria bacterium]|nr:spermidine/putrescine ABC transporter substrate-binding protein [Gammaproteobacteria bacterium]MDD9874336.1 spermidine/putrescine ABC transporter substrate-binding protein [Gammaproteobacteria bacterium]
MKKTPFISNPGRRTFLAGLSAIGAAAAGLRFSPALAAEEKKLNFYNWDTYIGETTLADFKAASGIEVNMDLFADLDEMFAKLREGNPGYDLIVPGNDYVERMITAGMLQPLDHSLIPNFKNVDPNFRDAQFDPGRRYSMPYMWGTIGIGYRKSKVREVPDSWKWLYDSDRYAGRIALLGDASTIFQMAFKYLGYSLNTTDPAHFEQAERLVIKQKPHIKAFADDNGQDLLAAGEVDLTMEWNGDILQVMEEDDDIGYAVPREGGLLWQDCLSIPKGAPRPMNAHRFIDYILEAEVGKLIAEYIYYATPNKAARDLASPDYSRNPNIFPSDDVVANCETALYLGEDIQRLYDEGWTRINAA